VRALVFTGPNRVELLDVDEPAPVDGEIVVEVAAAGICGSELHGIKTPGFRKPPLVMGHEFAGFTPDGRRVAVNPLVSCGACDLCRLGYPELCRERALLGVHRPGGFAERVAVPEGSAFPIPDSLSFEAAAMVEPIANAVHAWGIAGHPAGQRIGIVGAGTIGLLCLLVAAERGAASASVADLAPERVKVARALGASEAAGELVGEFDVVFDAVGAPATRRASVDRLRPGGTAAWLGLMESEAGFDSLELVRNEKRVLGSFAYRPEEFEEAIGLAGRFDLSWSRLFPLSEGASIFGELMNGRTDIVKALLQPSG
jgi:threonine dehydrogenase-like Zn-dependent dehydrogenase